MKMKVKCPRCGKVFSYEERNGICDQCNFYMSKPIPAPETQLQKDWKFMKIQKIGCAILIGLMILVPLIAIPNTNKLINQRLQERKIGVLQPQTADMQETVKIGEEKIQITTCAQMDEWQKYAPEGFSIVLVTYQAQDLPDSSFSYDTSVYIELPSGEYIEPVNSYRLAEEIGEARECLVESCHIVDGVNEKSGSFAFLVPVDTKQAMLALYYRPEKSGTRVLETIYQIAINWEEA